MFYYFLFVPYPNIAQQIIDNVRASVSHAISAGNSILALMMVLSLFGLLVKK